MKIDQIMQFRAHDLNSSYYLSLTSKNSFLASTVVKVSYFTSLFILVGEIVTMFDKIQTCQLDVIFNCNFKR